MKTLHSGPSLRIAKPKGRSDDGRERQKMYKQKRWRDLRAQHLKAMPYCEECMGETGYEKRSWIVDHIRGHDHPGWRQDFYNPANLQTLCARHHNKKTKRERPTSGVAQIAKKRLTRTERARLIQERKND